MNRLPASTKCGPAPPRLRAHLHGDDRALVQATLLPGDYLPVVRAHLGTALHVHVAEQWRCHPAPGPLVPIQFAMDDPANEDLFATPTPAASMYYPDWLHCVRGWVGLQGVWVAGQRTLCRLVDVAPCRAALTVPYPSPSPRSFPLPRRSWLASSCGCLICWIQCFACSTGRCTPSPSYGWCCDVL